MSVWQGLSETAGDAEDRDPAPGVGSEAPLADGRAVAAPAARPRVCARACAWGAGRAAAEGRREGGGGRPSPPVAAPGAAPLRAWDRRLPVAAATAATRWRDSRSAPRPPASAADSASCWPGRRFYRSPGLGSAEEEEMSAAASPAPERGWKSEKVDEAQALARSCAARRPDFQPCDGLSICATHSHGKCFKLHWCCHLGWCHCKYVYQPMTPVEQLPSTEIPAKPREPTNTIQISVSLTEHFLKFASVFQPPLPPDSPRYCMISDLFIDNYQVKCINGKMCYVQKQPAPHSHKMSPEEVSAHDALISKESNTPKIDHCSSPSSSEDSGINAIGAHYVESCDEDTEEGAELSSEEDYSPESSWEPDECTLLSPSQSDLEVIETIETTV